VAAIVNAHRSGLDILNEYSHIFLLVGTANIERLAVETVNDDAG